MLLMHMMRWCPKATPYQNPPEVSAPSRINHGFSDGKILPGALSIQGRRSISQGHAQHPSVRPELNLVTVA
jgi:hypothetical protein